MKLEQERDVIAAITDLQSVCITVRRRECLSLHGD
jgi:hypothetical protein